MKQSTAVRGQNFVKIEKWIGNKFGYTENS